MNDRERGEGRESLMDSQSVEKCGKGVARVLHLYGSLRGLKDINCMSELEHCGQSPASTGL